MEVIGHTRPGAGAAARTILVVDDDGDVRETMSIAFTMLGFIVVTCCDGLDALAWLCAHGPVQLILLDWNMPRCGGAEFRARQLDDPRFAAIPVVLVTGEDEPGEKAAAARVDDWVRKPVELDRLLALVARRLAG